MATPAPRSRASKLGAHRVKPLSRPSSDCFLLVLLAFVGFGVWLARAREAAAPRRVERVTLLSLDLLLLSASYVINMACPTLKLRIFRGLFSGTRLRHCQDRLCWANGPCGAAMPRPANSARACRLDLFGEGVLKLDKRQRILGLHAIAEQAPLRVRRRKANI